MKKFWKNVEIQESKNNNFQILLDKNTLKTPMQNELFFLVSSKVFVLITETF